MTVTRGLALFLTVAAAGALVNASAPPPAPSPTVRLKAISARVNAKGASLVIEASEPVAVRRDAARSADRRCSTSATSRADGVANSVAADAKSPIAARRRSKPAESLGAPASRVRIALSQPVAHHVRSERNTVVVDFDRPSAKAAPYVLPPASRATAPAPRPMRCWRSSRSRRAPIRSPRSGSTRRRRTVRVGAVERRAPPVARRAGRRRRGAEPGRGAARGRAAAGAAVAAAPEQPIGGSRGRQFTGPPDQPRLPGRRSARRAAHLRRDQRPEHRHRSDRAGHGRRRAARRAVGSGARHHPARQQARLLGRRHDRPHRAARRADGRRGRAQGAARRAGDCRPARHAARGR